MKCKSVLRPVKKCLSALNPPDGLSTKQVLEHYKKVCVCVCVCACVYVVCVCEERERGGFGIGHNLKALGFGSSCQGSDGDWGPYPRMC